MSFLITDNHVSNYQRDGVVLLKRLFDKQWLEILAEGIEENLRKPSNRTTTFANNHTDDTPIYQPFQILNRIAIDMKFWPLAAIQCDLG